MSNEQQDDFQQYQAEKKHKSIRLTHDHDAAGVTLTGVKIPFFSLMGFLIKFIIASIPAIIIASIILFIIGVVFTGVFGGLAGLGVGAR